MKWGAFFATMIIVMIIVFLQWPKMKTNPKKDKTAFIILLAIGLLLSMFNLQYIKGPSAVRQFLFKPFIEYMQK